MNRKMTYWKVILVSYLFLFCRAEPLLDRIKADRTVVVSPVFDKVHFDDLHVERYIPFSHGFDWAMWCTYEHFSSEWVKKMDESQPGKYVKRASKEAIETASQNVSQVTLDCRQYR